MPKKYEYNEPRRLTHHELLRHLYNGFPHISARTGLCMCLDSCCQRKDKGCVCKNCPCQESVDAHGSAFVSASTITSMSEEKKKDGILNRLENGGVSNNG